MSKDLISKKTRYEFREYLVNWTLREIAMEFDAADIQWTDCDPGESGQRRTLVEQYYASVDFKNWADAKKVLCVYENIINSIYDYYPDQAKTLIRFLQKDGFVYQDGKIEPATSIPSAMSLKSLANELDAVELRRQISRIESSIDIDPALALGTAKELVETCCHSILKERQVDIANDLDIPQLVKITLKELRLLPEDIPDSAKGAKIIKRLLSNLATVSQGLAELRNLYGTGHGRHGKAKGIQRRHALLAAGAATTLVTFLFETSREDRT